MWDVELACARINCQGYTIALTVERSPILGGLSERVCPYCKRQLILAKVEDRRPKPVRQRKVKTRPGGFRAEQLDLF